MEPNEKDWLRIKNFLASAHNRPVDTDAFVSRVMANLPAQRPSVWTFWPGAWWKVPAVTFAAMAIFLMAPQANGDDFLETDDAVSTFWEELP